MHRHERDLPIAAALSAEMQARTKRENAARDVQQKCCGKVISNYWCHPCGKNASWEHEGKWYCKTHHPPTIQAKNEARHAKWEAEWAAETEARRTARLAADEQKRRAQCYPELLDALQAVVDAAGPEAGPEIGKAAAAIARATGATP